MQKPQPSTSETRSSQTPIDNVTQGKEEVKQKYSYVGQFAKKVDRSALEEAEYMEQFGKNSPKEIRDATGWFRGKDGKWRLEISDKDMTVKPEQSRMSSLWEN